MVWVKLTDDFPDAAARAELSDAAFRVHVEGLCWAMRRENGGLLDRVDIRKACETEDPKPAIRELVGAGWWQAAPGDRLQIVHSMDDQPEPEVIQARRCNDASRQRRKRRRAAGLDLSRRDTPRESGRDDPRDPGRAGTGRDGKPPTQPVAMNRGEERQPQLGEDAWPPVTAPGAAASRLAAHESDDYCRSCGMTAGHTGSCKASKGRA